jgi:ABC-type multidrug transport system fused ATPase/permease subunit
MTESTATPAGQKAPPSFWEDLVDIFFQPAEVFRRREKASFWPPTLVVAVLLSVFTYVNMNVLQPIMDAEFARQSAIMLKKNPQVTQEMLDKGRGFAEIGQRYGSIIVIPIILCCLGLVLWGVGKLFGSRQTVSAAILVAAYSYFPRVLEAALAGAQGLLMDPAKLTSRATVQFNPARFLDPNATSQMTLAILGRVDLFVIWTTVLLSIGVYSTGRVSKTNATLIGVVMWILGALLPLRQALMSS